MPDTSPSNDSVPAIPAWITSERSARLWTVISGVAAVIGLCLAVALSGGGTDSRNRTDGVPDDPPGSAGEPTATLPSESDPSLPPFKPEVTTYLSDLVPVDESDSYWWYDDPQIMDTEKYAHSLSATPCAHDMYRTYLFSKDYMRFRASAGIDDNSKSTVPTEVLVIGDNDTILRRATARSGDPVELDVPIKDVLRLTIKVKDSGGRCTDVRVVWGNARIER